MAKLANLARVTTATTGTGTITLGSAVSGYLTFAGAGVADGDIISYGIKDGTDSEVGTGVYTSSGTTLTRVVTKSTNSDSAVSLSGTAEVYITARAEDIVPDEARRNALLNAIYQSKLFGDYRRFLNMFATGFKAATDTLRGINAGSSSNYDVTNAAASGYILPTTSVPTLITWSGPTNIGDMTGGGGLAAGFDGTTNQATAAGARRAAANPAWIGRYKAGDPKTVTRVRVYAPNNNNINGGNVSGASGTIKIYGKVTGQATTSTDGVELYSAAFTDGTNGVGGNIIDITTGITPQASESVFVRIDFGANTTYDVNLAEVQFYEGVTATNNMTVVTASQTADATVNRARALVEFDNTATPTLDTDLTVEVTCDGGSNWTAGTLSSVSTNGQAGRKIAEIADTSCTAGTSFAARVKTLNNKNVPIYGVTVTVH